MAKPNYNITFASKEELALAHAEARRNGNSLAGLIRDTLSGGAPRLLARASGKLDESAIRFALDSAGAVLDDGSFGGVDVGDWLHEADLCAAWLRGRPYHPDGAGRVLNWWGSMPDAVRARMRAAVQ